MYDQQQPYQPYPQQPAGPHPYKKLGGWPLFLVVVAIFGVAIKLFGLLGSSGIFVAFSQLSIAGWQPLVDNLLNLAILAASVVFAVLLFKRSPRFLICWQIGWAASLAKQLIFAATMLSGFIGITAEEFLELYLAQAQDYRFAQLEALMAQTGLTPEGFGSIVMGFIFAVGIGAVLVCVLRLVFVTLFYRRSVRVRTYMGSGEYLRQAAFTRKANPQPAVPDDAAIEKGTEEEFEKEWETNL